MAKVGLGGFYFLVIAHYLVVHGAHDQVRPDFDDMYRLRYQVDCSFFKLSVVYLNDLVVPHSDENSVLLLQITKDAHLHRRALQRKLCHVADVLPSQKQRVILIACI